MQRRIIDSVAPGSVYSPRGYTIYGRIYEACNILLRTQSHYVDWEREK